MFIAALPWKNFKLHVSVDWHQDYEASYILVNIFRTHISVNVLIDGSPALYLVEGKLEVVNSKLMLLRYLCSCAYRAVQ